MGAEKVAAFYESWGAMFLEGYLASMRLWASPAWWLSLTGTPGSVARRISTQQGDMALAIASRGLAPIQRRATANAARLRRAR